MSKPDNVPPMQYRFLGNTGLQVSVLGLGGWLTFGGYVDRENTNACMKAAYDCGINFFDSAEVYADGESERAMGEAIKKFGWKRNDLVVTTKIYWGKAYSDIKINNTGLSRKHVIEGLDASLARLGLDYVDIVYAHRYDRLTPMEETVRAFNHVISAGKAFYWGTSEWRPEEVAQAQRLAERLSLVGPVVEQPAYNMLERRNVESDLALLCRGGGDCGRGSIGLTIFSPLKQGVLTGKYCEGAASASGEDEGDGDGADGGGTTRRMRFNPADNSAASKELEGFREHIDPEGWDAVVARTARLRPVAERLGVSMAALALAWVLKNPHVSCAITGASRPEQIYDNVRALDVLPRLTAELMAEIDEVLGNKPPEIEDRIYN